MTKRKTIDQLLRKYDDDGSAENLSERAYESGRIAGLREAAGMIDPGDAFDKESEQDVALANGSLAIRIKADARAKDSRRRNELSERVERLESQFRRHRDALEDIACALSTDAEVLKQIARKALEKEQ